MTYITRNDICFQHSTNELQQIQSNSTGTEPARATANFFKYLDHACPMSISVFYNSLQLKVACYYKAAEISLIELQRRLAGGEKELGPLLLFNPLCFY